MKKSLNELKLSDTSIDTLKRLAIIEKIAPLCAKYGIYSYVDLYKTIMTSDDFYDKIVSAVNEPEDMWISRMYKVFMPRKNHLRVVK